MVDGALYFRLPQLLDRSGCGLNIEGSASRWLLVRSYSWRPRDATVVVHPHARVDGRVGEAEFEADFMINLERLTDYSPVS